MTTKERLKKGIDECLKETDALIKILSKSNNESFNKITFSLDYQKWYSKVLKIVAFFGSDRLQEFKSYYETNPKGGELGFGNYCIQDYLKGVAPSPMRYHNFDCKAQALKNLINQYTILVSIENRIDSVFADIQTTLLVELQDTELETAKALLKINIRASGVLAGVVLEGYLSSIIQNHGIKLAKKNPSLSDFNEVLKNNNIYEVPTWRKITYLADIRNTCAHSKSAEPTKEQIEELISGVNWVMKNVY